MEDLEEMLQTSQIVYSDAETQYADEVLNEMRKLISTAKNTAQSLRLLAAKLDRVWKSCKTARAVGTSFGMMGGLLTVATFFTAGAATPLVILGMAAGGAGATTNVAAGGIEAYITSTELKRVQQELKTTIDCADRVNGTLQRLQDGKEVGKLLCINHRAFHTLTKTDPVKKLLQRLISQSFSVLFTTKFKDCGAKIGAKLAAKAAAAAGVADDFVVAAVKTGTQTADDVVGAGVKASTNASKIAGRLIIGVSAAFLVWDTIDLCFTIKDLIEEKGSEAAKGLREKASQIEKHCSLD